MGKCTGYAKGGGDYIAFVYDLGGEKLEASPTLSNRVPPLALAVIQEDSLKNCLLHWRAQGPLPRDPAATEKTIM
jgi:hypothetical protein